MKNLTRRNFLGSTAAGLTLASGLGAGSNAGAIDIAFTKEFKPQEMSFMDQYYYGILNINKGIRATEVQKIAQAMTKAYELKRKGGKIFSHVNYGHYSMFGGSRDLPGQPNVLPQCGINPTKEEFDSMKKGDFLITDRIDQGAIDARKRGLYVVGITNNYFKFAKTAPEGLIPERMKISIEEISDLVIDSYVPWDNGLVTAPRVSQVKLCPGTGIAQFLVYWSATAALATLIGSKGKDSPEKPIEKYLDLAYERFTMIGTDRPKIDHEAEIWADLVLENKARLLVYGHPQDVEYYDGARNIFVNDAYICSSSSMIADQYEKKSNSLKSSDIVLIGGFTSDNALEISVARHARSVGARCTAFCPFGTDGDSSGVRLFKEADVAFNTYADESEGVIDIKGFDKKISPLSTLTGNLVMWMLTAQWTDHMARRGEMPYYWKGYHENGGKEYDEMAKAVFDKRGY